MSSLLVTTVVYDDNRSFKWGFRTFTDSIRRQPGKSKVRFARVRTFTVAHAFVSACVHRFDIRYAYRKRRVANGRKCCFFNGSARRPRFRLKTLLIAKTSRPAKRVGDENKRSRTLSWNGTLTERHIRIEGLESVFI